jgi:hypothetical protein
MHLGSVSFLEFLVPSACPLEFHQLYVITAPSTRLSSCGRERSRMELSQGSTVGEEQLPSCFEPKFPAQYKPYAVVRCHDGVPSCSRATSLDVFTSRPPSNALEHRERALYCLIR